MVQAVIEKRIEEVLAKGFNRIVNLTPYTTYDYILKDSGGNELNRVVYRPEEIASVVGTTMDGVTVASYELIDNGKAEAHRRDQRQEKFSNTVDTLNPAWYDSLSDDQKARIKAFRKAWLDYPETGSIPDTITFNEGQPDEVTVSTDVSDIFPNS